MKLKCDDIQQVYVWIDDHTDTIELSPHFDYEEDALQWRDALINQLKGKAE